MAFLAFTPEFDGRVTVMAASSLKPSPSVAPWAGGLDLASVTEFARAIQSISEKSGKSVKQLMVEAQRLLAQSYGVAETPMRLDGMAAGIKVRPDGDLEANEAGDRATEGDTANVTALTAKSACGHANVASLLGLDGVALGLPPIPEHLQLCADCRANARERGRLYRQRSKLRRQLALERLEAQPKTMLPPADPRVHDVIDQVVDRLLGSHMLEPANDALVGALLIPTETRIDEPLAGASVDNDPAATRDEDQTAESLLGNADWWKCHEQRMLEAYRRLPPPPKEQTLLELLTEIGVPAVAFSAILGPPLFLACLWAPWLAVGMGVLCLAFILVETWRVATGREARLLHLLSLIRSRPPPAD